MPELPFPLPTVQQVVFLGVAAFVALTSLTVVLSRNLFYNALALVGTLFGVAGIYLLLEAEFLAISQILVYVGAIATLITFAIMLTRGIMFGHTSPTNHQFLPASIMGVLFFIVMAGVISSGPWSGAGEPLTASAESMIADLGVAFATTYVIPFEAVGVLLLVALVGAVMLARDK
jgi:NADH-quinone oxidoreductase subunit J